MSFTSWLSSWKQPRRRPIVSSAGARRKKAHYGRPGLERLEDRLAPAIYLVNVLTDTAPGSGGAGSGTAGDLRYCITQANAQGTSSSNTIVVGVTGVISLAAVLPAINDNLTFTGSGASALTVNGNSLGSVFTINSGETVSLSSLTITGGSGRGAGILNSGTLTVTNTTFSANSASGRSGGGIYSTGTVTVSNSTFSGNTATNDGGGLFNYFGTVTVSNSTFSGNSTSTSGGGLGNYGGTMVVVNSTLSGNSASGSGNQGGGIFTNGTMTLQNTIVAGNTATASATDPDIAGSVSASVVISGATYTEGYNLIGVGAGSSGVTNGANGDQVGTAASPINPELGPLQDNGGPTETLALADNSPAINAGVTAFATLFDQRGVAWPIGTPSDVGAYQLLTLGTNALTEGAAAGTDTDVVTFTGAWTVASNASWLHISSGGTGNGLATFTFDANTGATRTGTLTIALEVVTVTQADSNYVAANPFTTLTSLANDGPTGVAVDGAGNVYFALVNHADSNLGELEEWNAATQTVTTLVAPSFTALNSAGNVAVDSLGNVYIADAADGAIMEYNAATQTLSTLVPGLNNPDGVAVDSAGNVYIADTIDNAIDEWNATTQMSGPLVTGLNNPVGVAVDSAGNVYILNNSASVTNVEEWNSSTHSVTPLISTGLSNPQSIAVDGSGNLYIADTGDKEIQEWVAATRKLSPLVPGLNYPDGVTVDAAGNVYVSDFSNSAIQELPRAFVPSGAVSEPAAAGSDALLPVLPASELLAAPFAPTSNQSWLTVGTVSSGAVHFSFTQNTGVARTAQLTVLGQQINVTQPSGQTTPTFSNLYPSSITYGTATQTISGQLNGNGGGAIPQGETVVVTLNGVPQNATLTSSDAFSTLFNTSMLSVSSSPYTISFSYAGDANFTSASTTSNLTVNALAVTLTGSETYNGSASAAASALTVSNKVSGDTLTLSGSVVLASANVGAESITSFAGLTLGGSSASNYTLTGATGSVTVNARAVTLTGSETYNGSASAPASALTVSNKVSGDTLTLSGSVTLASANPGTETITSFAGLTLGGSSASNYTLTGATGSVTVSAPGQTTPTFSNLSAPTITYGTATTVVSGQLNGNGSSLIPSSETVKVTLNGVPQNAALTSSDAFSTTFNTATLSVSGSPYTIGFSYAGDTNFTSASAGSTLTVTTASLSILPTTQTHTYGSGSLGTTAFTSFGLQNSETIGSVTLSTNASISGSGNYNTDAYNSQTPWTIVPSAATGGTFTASNYAITYDAGPDLTINPQPVTISGMTASNKTYDGTTTATIDNSGDALATVISGDQVTLDTSSATASFSQANAGNNLTVTGAFFGISGADANDYSLGQQPTAMAGITPAPLTITALDQTLTYGFGSLGTTAFTVLGLVGSDHISGVALATTDNSSTSGHYQDPPTSNTITASSAPVFSSGSSANYSITSVPGTLIVTPLALTVAGISGTNKTYDSTANDPLNDPLSGTPTLSGLISGDVVKLGGTGVGTLASANTGTEAVTVSGYTISGADAVDYTLSQPTVANVTVFPQTPPPGGGLLHLSDNGHNGIDLTVPILAAGDIVTLILYHDQSTGFDRLQVFTTDFDQIDYTNTDIGPNFPVVQDISVSDSTLLEVYLANDSASPDTLQLIAPQSPLSVIIGANPITDGAPPVPLTQPVTDTADTVKLYNINITGDLIVYAKTIDVAGGGAVPYQGAVAIQSGPNPGEYILTPTAKVDWQALGFAGGDKLNLAGLPASWKLGSSSVSFGLGTGVVDSISGNSLYVSGIEPITANAPTNSTMSVTSGTYNLTVSVQGAQVKADIVSLTSVDSLTLQSTGVPKLGNVTIHAAPLTGQPYAGFQYVTGPDWGAYGYQPGDFITIGGPIRVGEVTISYDAFIVEAIAGDNLYLAGSANIGTNTYTAGTVLPTGNFSDIDVAGANFTPQITTASGSGELSLNVTGQGNSISGAIASIILAAQTNNGNITLFDTGSPFVDNNEVLIKTVDAGTANIQLDTLGSIVSDYTATPAANVAIGIFNLKAAAVDLRTAATNSSIGAAPPGAEVDKNGNPVPAADQVLATAIGKLTATTNDGSVNIYNAGAPGSAASPLTIDSVVADTDGQAPTVNDDQIVYNLTPEFPAITFSNINVTAATVSFVALLQGGGIASVTPTPTNGGSGYPASATFYLRITGGGGSGGVVQAHTDASGVITSFDAGPVERGFGYSSTSGASTSFSPPSNVVITSTGPIVLNSISATGPVTVQGTYIVKGNGQSQGMVTPHVSLVATGTAQYQGPVTFADAGASTTIAGGNGGSDGVSLPQSTINVVSTAGFPISGMLSITIGVNIVSVTYTGITPTSFTGCLGGGGMLAAGDAVAGTSPNTTIASGVSLTPSTPITIAVASTAGFASSGTILVTTSGGSTVAVSYTSLGSDGTSFAGCTGSGTLAAGDPVVTGDTLTLPAGQSWTSYGFSNGSAMAGVSIVLSGAAVTANDGTFTVASVSGSTLTLEQSYVVDPETEPVVTVGEGMIGLAGNAGNPTSNDIDLSEVGSFSAQTANGNIYLALGGTVDSTATSVIAGGMGNVSLTSAAQFLTIENVTANGAPPPGGGTVIGGNVGVAMNSGSLLEYPPTGSFTGTVTIKNAASDGSATGGESSLTGTDWAAAGFAPGDVITISGVPSLIYYTDYTIASISGGTLYLDKNYIADLPGDGVTVAASVATVAGLSSQIKGQNVFLTSALSIGTAAAPLLTNAASGLSVTETATSPSEAAVYVDNAYKLSAVAVTTYGGSVAIKDNESNGAFPVLPLLSFSNTVLSENGSAVVSFTNSDENDGSNDNVQVKGTINASAISSASGQILAYDSSAMINGQLLMLSAGNGIGVPGASVHTDVTALVATTTTGGVYVNNEAGASYQGQVTFAQNAGGDTLTANGTTPWNGFAAGDTIVVSGSGASANDADFIIASISGGTLTLAESDVVNPETDLSVTVQDTLPVSASTSNGNIDVSSQGSMTLEGISTKPNGTVTLDAGGTIYNPNRVNAQSATITTGTLILTANQVGTASNPLKTSINFLTAGAPSGAALGSLYLSNNTALTVNAANVAGNVALSTIGNLALNAPVSLGSFRSRVTVTVTATAGALTTTGNVSLNAGVLTIAAESIGSPTDVVQTNANSINATADYGGMYISNDSAAPLTLTAASVGPTINLAQTNNIEIYSAGNIVIDPQANSLVGSKPVGIFNPGGTLTLYAGEKLSADGKTTTATSSSTITGDVSSYQGQVTFAPNASGDTMTLPASGPTWTSLGFVPGDGIAVSGASASTNNGTFTIASISADGFTLTLTARKILSAKMDLTVSVNNVRAYLGQVAFASPYQEQVTFAPHAGGDTMTLPASGPTWTSLGFVPGDAIVASGASASANNGTFTIASISADGFTLTLTVGNVLSAETDLTVSVNSVKSYQGLVTFAPHAGGDTMTLPASGPTWTSLGFVPGDAIVASGASASANNGTFTIASISADGFTLTLTVRMVLSAEPGVTASVKNPTGDKLTLPTSGPTWTALGFAPGDPINVSGTKGTANDGSFIIANIFGYTLTLTTTDVLNTETDSTVTVNAASDIETGNANLGAPGNAGGVSSSLQLHFNHIEVPVSVPQGRVANSAPLELTLYALQTAIANDTLHTPLTYSASSIIIADLGTSLGAPLQIPDSLVLTTAGGPIIFINPNNAIEVTGSTKNGLNTITINAGTTTSKDGVVSANSGATSNTAVAALCNLSTGGGNMTVNAVGNISIGTFDAGIGHVSITSVAASIFSSNGAALALGAGSTTLQSAPQPPGPTRSTALAQLNATEAIANAAAANAEAAAEQITANALQSELTSINTAVTNDLQTYQAAVLASHTADGVVKTDSDQVTLLTNVVFGLSIAAALASTVSAYTQVLGTSLEATFLPLTFAPSSAAVIEPANAVQITAAISSVAAAAISITAVGVQGALNTASSTLSTDSGTASSAQSAQDQAAARLAADMDTQAAFSAAYNLAQQAATSAALVAKEEEVTSAQAIAAVAATATPPPVNATESVTVNGPPSGPTDSGFAVNNSITVTHIGAGVTITSNSPLAVNANITAPGPVTMTAATRTLPETGDDLTVNSGVIIQSTDSTVSFLAGDNVVIPAGATIDAGSTITITGDANDNPSGALVTVYGTLNATSALIDVDPNSTGPDTFNIIPSATTPITVTGGQGTDTLDFNAEGLAVTLSGNTITAAGMQPVTFTNIAVVHITNAAHGGARFVLTGTSGQANALSLVGTEQGAGTVTLNGVALSFSGVASFNYQGGSGDAISVTPFATSLIPWNLAVAVAGGTGSPASLTYNSVASLADTFTVTAADAGTIGSPGLAAVQFSNVGTITTDASQSPGDALTVNVLGTAPGAIVQSAGPNSVAIGLAGLSYLDLAEYASVTINASDTTGNGLFEVAETAVLRTGLNIHLVGNPVFNDYLFVMGAAGQPSAIISKSAIAGNGSVTVGTPNPVTYQNIGTVKYLPVNSAAKVIQQPTNQTVLVNTVATFTALASANPAPTVQWEESTNKGKTFQPIAGATSLSYSFTPQASDNGDQFKAVFTSSVGKPAVTTPAKLTVTVPAAPHVNSLPVKSAPKVTQQPVSKTVAVGAPVTFTVAASGTPAPTVQWMVSAGKGKPFTAIAGATALSYTYTPQAGNSGELFEAVFTNAAGKVTTSAATLTVDVPPGVQADPSDQTAVKGKATFSVVLTGTKPTVQWQVSSDGGKTWSNVKGATAATLTLKGLTSLQDQWEYRVLVTNVLGTFTSGAGTLSV